MLNRKIQLQFLLVLLVGVLIISFFIFKPFLATLILAIIFAVVLQPLYKKLLERTKHNETLASLATVFISIICILIPVTFLGFQIFQESAQLYNSLSLEGSKQNIIITVLESVGKIVGNIIPGTQTFFTNLSTNIDVYVKQGLVWLINHLGVALSGVSTLLLDLFIFFISLYYLLRDGPKLKESLIKLSPLDDKDDTIIFTRLESAVNSVIKGNLFIALTQGVLTAIGFTIFGIPNSILWGTLTAISALIPGIGTALIIIPGVIYLFVIGSTIPAIGLLAWGVLAVGLIDNILGPRLVGHNLQLHPLFVLLSVLGGLAFFGPIGLFLGPITMSLLFAFISIYVYLSHAPADKAN